MTTDLLSRPSTGLGRLREEVNDLFSRFLPNGTLFEATSLSFAPPIEIIEKNSSVIVRAEIPGVTPDDIDLAVNADTLTVRGEKRKEERGDDDGHVWVERSFGSFSRIVTLPCRVLPGKADATYKAGVLEVKLKKADSSDTRKVKVKKG